MDQDAQTEGSIEYIEGQSSLFGIDKSDAYYQKDQTTKQKQLETQKIAFEAEQISLFKKSSARRSDKSAHTIANPVKLPHKSKLILDIPVKIVPQKKRPPAALDVCLCPAVDADSSVKKVKHDIMCSKDSAKTVELAAKSVIQPLFDYPSTDDDEKIC